MSRTIAMAVKKRSKSEKALSGAAEDALGHATNTDESEGSVDMSDSKSEEEPAEPKDKNGCNFWNIFIFIIITSSISVSIYFAYSENMSSDVDMKKNWEEGLQNLQVNFTGQTSRFWKTLKHRGLAHLRNDHPKQPLVFLLAAVPRAHGIVDCLATKLAELLDPLKKNNLSRIVGRDLQNTQGDETKKTMDVILCNAFKKGKRVALIHHLHLLPPPSPILFYSYCDDQNAPYKHAALIFTVHLPREPDASLTAVEAEGSVEKFLAQEVWADSPYNQDEIPALLSRIADTVVLVYSLDKSSSVDSYCKD